jgi:hypothetical protein
MLIHSLHNERYRGCLLWAAGSAGDGYRVGPGWCTACLADWRGACGASAPRLTQHATDEEEEKSIAQMQSAFWGSEPEESEHNDWDQQPSGEQRNLSTARGGP